MSKSLSSVEILLQSGGRSFVGTLEHREISAMTATNQPSRIRYDLLGVVAAGFMIAFAGVIYSKGDDIHHVTGLLIAAGAALALIGIVVSLFTSLQRKKN